MVRFLDKYFIHRMRKSGKILYINILVLCACSLSSCGNDLITDPAQITFPATNVSYGQHVRPLFTLACSYNGCHATDAPAADLRLVSYYDLFSKPGLTIANNPDGSLLAQIISGKVAHRLSFQGRITTNHVEGVRQWIKEGAKNN